jgi:hypothetical protein
MVPGSKVRYMMKKMRSILILGAAFIIAGCFIATASAAVRDDAKAGFSIKYDEENWKLEDITNMFGDLSEFDDKLVSTPFVVANPDEEAAAVIVVVSKRDNYDNDVLAFIEINMGQVDAKSIYEGEDTFTDSSGDEYDSKVRVWGVTPEFEEEGIFVSQVFFAKGKRYEICFLALPDNFLNTWESAKGIIDSIDVK